MAAPAIKNLGSLIMGRVSHDRYRNVVKIGIPKHRFNSHICMYFREQESIYALDEGNICASGDWVLLRKQASPIDEGVNHKVEKLVYKYGEWIDPLTGRRSLGIHYDDEMRRLEEIKLQV